MGKTVKKLKGALLALVLLSSASKGIIAEDLTKSQLINNNSKVEIELDTNYNYNSYNNLSNVQDKSYDENNLNDQNQVLNIFEDIINNKINSYQQLIQESKNSSENQKLDLLAQIGNCLYYYNYKQSLQNPSQQVLFNVLQNDLEGNTNQTFGVCRQIASGIEQLAEDMGEKAAVVSTLESNNGHAYTLIKTQTGLAIVNSYDIFKTNTNNVEETLREYQNQLNSITFQHLFFKDNQFKYNLITEEGQEFLNFIDYDPSSLSLKNKIINPDPEDNNTRLKVNLGNNENSLGIYNLLGIFNTKAGEIYFPLDNTSMYLGQIGLKKTFPIFNKFELIPKINFLCGNISNEQIIGVDGCLSFNTLNKTRLNFGTKFSGDISVVPPLQPLEEGENCIFNDYNINAGISYRFLGEKFSLTPYFIAQENIFQMRLSDYDYSPSLEELTGGISINAPIKNTNLLLTPYYSWKPWEQGVGTDLEIKNKNIIIDASEYTSKSTYEFAPDNLNLKLEGKIKSGNLELGINGSLNQKNYNGEISNEGSLGINGSLKF
jgi:hypothetical protein